MWALHALGVTNVFGPCASGSLQAHVAPGSFVVPDQIVDRTWGRPDTFFEGPAVHHVAFGDPYDHDLRRVAVEACRAESVEVHDGGTVVVVQGPRFSTHAESRWFGSHGWEVVNMTHYQSKNPMETRVASTAWLSFTCGSRSPGSSPTRPSST